MKSLSSATLPTIIVSLIFGLSQIWISKRQSCTYSTQFILRIILPLSYLLLYTYAISYILQSEYHANDVYKIALADTEVYDYLASIAATYIILCFNLKSNYRRKKCAKKIIKTDRALNDIGIEVNSKKLRCYQILNIIIGFTMTFILIVTQYKKSTEHNTDVSDVIITKEFILFLPLILIFITEFQFAVYALIIYQRFCYINASLRNMIQFRNNTTTNLIKVATVDCK